MTMKGQNMPQCPSHSDSESSYSVLSHNENKYDALCCWCGDDDDDQMDDQDPDENCDTVIREVVSNDDLSNSTNMDAIVTQRIRRANSNDGI